MRILKHSNHMAWIMVITICTAGCSSRNTAFDQNAWLQGDQISRGSMVRDLLSIPRSANWNYLNQDLLTKETFLFGMQESDIAELLGAPDRQQVFDNGESEMIYEFYDPKETHRNPPSNPPCSPYGYPPRLLNLAFDTDGVIVWIGVE